MTSSASTPADAPVLHGCIAFLQHMQLTGLSCQEAIVLFAIVRDDDNDLNEEEVMHLLRLKRDAAWSAMGDLESKGLVEYHSDRDFQHRITLTEQGSLQCLALLGAVLLTDVPTAQG